MSCKVVKLIAKNADWYASILFFFTVSTLIFTFPMALHAIDSLAGHYGDNIAWLSQVAWFKKAICDLRVNPLYSPYGFYPVGMDVLRWNFSLSNMMAIPFALAWGSIVAYNAMFFLSFILSGLSFYFFAWYVTKSRLASFFSAIAFMFTPYRIARSWGHFNELVGVVWIPLFLLYVHKTFDTKSVKHAVFAGLTFTLGSLTSGYCGTIMVVFLASFLLARLLTLRDVKSLAKIVRIVFAKYWKLGIVFFLMCLPTLPFIMYYSSLGFRKTHFSADPVDYVTLSPYHPIIGEAVRSWRPIFKDGGFEHILYLGIVPIVLAFYAVLKMRGARVIAIYSMIAIVFFILSLGRSLRFMDIQVRLTVPWAPDSLPLPMPYIFLNPFPPFSSIGVASRFGLGFIICVYVLSAIAMAKLSGKIKSWRKRMAAFSTLALITLFEFFPAPYPLTKVEVPLAYAWLAQQPGDFAIIEFPIPFDGSAFYHAVDTHGKRTTSGMANWWSPVVLKTLDELSFFQPDANGLFLKEVRVQLYREVGIRYILFHSSDFVRRFGSNGWGRAINLVNRTEGVSFIGKFDDVLVYAVA